MAATQDGTPQGSAPKKTKKSKAKERPISNERGLVKKQGQKQKRRKRERWGEQIMINTTGRRKRREVASPLWLRFLSIEGEEILLRIHREEWEKRSVVEGGGGDFSNAEQKGKVVIAFGNRNVL